VRGLLIRPEIAATRCCMARLAPRPRLVALPSPGLDPRSTQWTPRRALTGTRRTLGSRSRAEVKYIVYKLSDDNKEIVVDKTSNSSDYEGPPVALRRHADAVAEFLGDLPENEPRYAVRAKLVATRADDPRSTTSCDDG